MFETVRNLYRVDMAIINKKFDHYSSIILQFNEI